MVWHFWQVQRIAYQLNLVKHYIVDFSEAEDLCYLFIFKMESPLFSELLELSSDEELLDSNPDSASSSPIFELKLIGSRASWKARLRGFRLNGGLSS